MIQVHPTLFPDRVLKIELPGKNYPDISFERKEGHEKFYWNISVSPSVPVFISVDERRNWASSPVLNGWNKFLGICNCIQREPLWFSFYVDFNLSNKICLLFWKQVENSFQAMYNLFQLTYNKLEEWSWFKAVVTRLKLLFVPVLVS